MRIGSGEWLAVAYLTLVIGSLLSGVLGMNDWYEIPPTFVVGFLLSVSGEKLVSLLTLRRHTHSE